MNRTIAHQILTSEGGDEGCSAADVTVAEGLGAGVEPALGWVADVEVTKKGTPLHQGMQAIELQHHEVVGGAPAGNPRVGSEDLLLCTNSQAAES